MCSERPISIERDEIAFLHSECAFTSCYNNDDGGSIYMRANSSLINYRFCIFDSCCEPDYWGSVFFHGGTGNEDCLKIEDGSICCCGRIQSEFLNTLWAVKIFTIDYTNFTDNKSLYTSGIDVGYDAGYDFRTSYCNVVSNKGKGSCFVINNNCNASIEYCNFINNSIGNDSSIIESTCYFSNISKCALLQNSGYTVKIGQTIDSIDRYFLIQNCYIDPLSIPFYSSDYFMREHFIVDNESSINHTIEMRITNLNNCLPPLLEYANIKDICPSKRIIHYYRQCFLFQFIHILH